MQFYTFQKFSHIFSNIHIIKVTVSSFQLVLLNISVFFFLILISITCMMLFLWMLSVMCIMLNFVCLVFIRYWLVCMSTLWSISNLYICMLLIHTIVNYEVSLRTVICCDCCSFFFCFLFCWLSVFIFYNGLHVYSDPSTPSTWWCSLCSSE